MWSIPPCIPKGNVETLIMRRTIRKSQDRICLAEIPELVLSNVRCSEQETCLGLLDNYQLIVHQIKCF